MVDMLRLKNKKWGFTGCNALISIICAIIILSSPFESIAILWIFAGVSLIIEAVLDIVTILIGYIGDKDTKDEKDTEDDKDVIVPVDSIENSEENNIVE